MHLPPDQPRGERRSPRQSGTGYPRWHLAGSGAAAAAMRDPSMEWCCVCPSEDCKLEANSSSNGKEDPRNCSLLEHNDFYSTDCNPHAAASPNPGDRPD
ncbi:hypothetical protein ABZP36_014192 [Zizania latifolia]